MQFCALILFFVACSAIGFETGWLVGNSGPDASVLAAILPAIIGTFIGSIGVFIVRAIFRGRQHDNSENKVKDDNRGKVEKMGGLYT